MSQLIELWGSLGYTGHLALLLGVGAITSLAVASMFVREAPLTVEEQTILARSRQPRPSTEWIPWALIPALLYVGILAIGEDEQGPPATFSDKFWTAFLWVVVAVLGVVFSLAEVLYWTLWKTGILPVLLAFARWIWGWLSEGARYANEATGRKKGWLD